MTTNALLNMCTLQVAVLKPRPYDTEDIVASRQQLASDTTEISDFVDCAEEEPYPYATVHVYDDHFIIDGRGAVPSRKLWLP